MKATSYYTERHGMRQPIEKTYNITIEMYVLLFNCCTKYYNNLAWKYPEECPDGRGCCGLNVDQFDMGLKYEIPTLFRNNYGQIAIPAIHRNVFEPDDKYDEYDQFALLDYIEYFAQNCRNVRRGDFHQFFSHYHLTLLTSSYVFKTFQNDINEIFRKTGLLYQLTDEKIIERIVEGGPLTSEVENEISQIQEQGVRELLQEAIALYKQPYPRAHKNAVEKIWDAFERLKSYYTMMDKKASASQIVNDMADGQAEFVALFDEEFRALTKIGNDYRIRHHETNKVDITDDRHYDYFFNSCLSVISLAIQYLQ